MKRVRYLAGLLLFASPLPASPAAAEDWSGRCIQDVEKGNIAACEKAVAADPRNPVLRRHYARAMSFRGLYDSALEQYRQVTVIRPGEARSWYDYGYYLAFMRRYAEAVKPLERTVALNPGHIAALRALAISYASVRKPRKVFDTTIALARLGDRIAMFEISVFYQEAYGVRQDPVRAHGWLVRAAEAGHIGAMDRLVQVYQNGQLSQHRDDKKAEFWATQARRAREQ